MSSASAGPRHDEAGFTLIELIVCLTILAGILALLGGGLRSLSHGADRNNERIQMLDMISRAFDILKRDVNGLQRIAINDGTSGRYLFSGTSEHLRFVTIEPPYPTAEGPYLVDYSVSGKAPSVLIRGRAPLQPGQFTYSGATPANRVNLLEGRVSYRFRYGARSDKGMEWYDTWPFATRLPHVISLDIIDTRTSLPASPAFLVQLRANAEIGCLDETPTMCSANPNGELVATADGSQL